MVIRTNARQKKEKNEERLTSDTSTGYIVSSGGDTNETIWAAVEIASRDGRDANQKQEDDRLVHDKVSVFLQKKRPFRLLLHHLLLVVAEGWKRMISVVAIPLSCASRLTNVMKEISALTSDSWWGIMNRRKLHRCRMNVLHQS
jgi:hypothetical protein